MAKESGKERQAVHVILAARVPGGKLLSFESSQVVSHTSSQLRGLLCASEDHLRMEGHRFLCELWHRFWDV